MQMEPSGSLYLIAFSTRFWMINPTARRSATTGKWCGSSASTLNRRGSARRAQVVADALQQLAEIKFFTLQIDPPGVGPREQEKIFGDGSEMVHLLEQAFGPRLLFLRRVGIAQHFLNARAQDRNRRLKVM